MEVEVEVEEVEEEYGELVEVAELEVAELEVEIEVADGLGPFGYGELWGVFCFGQLRCQYVYAVILDTDLRMHTGLTIPPADPAGNKAIVKSHPIL